MSLSLKKIGLVILLLILLILIREWGAYLFYDPLLSYFKNDYLYKRLPEIHYLKYVVSIFTRYFLNATISLGVLYVLFKNKDIVKQASFLFIVLFIILIALLITNLIFKSNYLIIFYVRRFLIHPIILLLLIPYYYFYNIEKS